MTVQKTYVLLLSTETVPNHAAASSGSGSSPPHRRHILVARYDDPFGAAVVYTQDIENRILKALGKND